MVLERLQVSLVLNIETAQDLIADLHFSMDVCHPCSTVAKVEVTESRLAQNLERLDRDA